MERTLKNPSIDLLLPVFSEKASIVQLILKYYIFNCKVSPFIKIDSWDFKTVKDVHKDHMNRPALL